MLSYLRKIGTPIEEQADEVISRFLGWAREVVRVGLHSNPSIDLCKGTSPIFDLLKQHFSDTAFSSMPLADFYGTLPRAGEDPFDYYGTNLSNVGTCLGAWTIKSSDWHRATCI